MNKLSTRIRLAAIAVAPLIAAIATMAPPVRRG
jgi:hypothetical protein